MRTQTLFRHFAVFIIFVSLISCGQQTDPSIVRLSKYKESIQEAYHSIGLFCVTNQIPGLTVAVSINNKLVWADGFGHSNLEFKVKSLPDHKFRIGQVSELITGLTAAKLYEEGLFDIDKPVSDYLPELDKNTDTYTIRELGTHTSGIHREVRPAGKISDISLKKGIDSFIHDKLDFAPGQLYGHTELGYDLLGYLIQKLKKETFPRVVKSTLLEPLKMTSTLPDNPFLIYDKKSSCYATNYMSQSVAASRIDLRGKEASAGYDSSVLDLIKMGNAVLFPGFLKQKTLDMLTTPYKLKSGAEGIYGFGLISSTDNQGERFYGARGAVAGGNATLLIYPEDKMVVAIATNINSETLELPVFDVAAIFRKHLHPDVKRDKPETNSEKKK